MWFEYVFGICVFGFWGFIFLLSCFEGLPLVTIFPLGTSTIHKVSTLSRGEVYFWSASNMVKDDRYIGRQGTGGCRYGKVR